MVLLTRKGILAVAMLIKNASVPLDVAAKLTNVEVRAIRHWAMTGAITIEQQADMEVVRVDHVRQLAGSPGRAGSDPQNDALRERLAGATVDDLSVLGLQERARGEVVEPEAARPTKRSRPRLRWSK